MLVGCSTVPPHPGGPADGGRLAASTVGGAKEVGGGPKEEVWGSNGGSPLNELLARVKEEESKGAAVADLNVLAGSMDIL